MIFSRQTLAMFKELLDDVRLPSSHPQFMKVALVIQAAREELDAAVAELDQPDPVPVAEAIVQHAGTMEDPDPADPVQPARVKNL